VPCDTKRVKSYQDSYSICAKKLINEQVVESVACVSLNCRSIRNKTQRILDYLIDHKITIAFLQETWLQATDKDTLSEISEYNYKLMKTTRVKEVVC